MPMVHKLTKALAISTEVKQAVAERDSIDGFLCCVWCGRAGLPEAHYIPRSHLGLGIEQNILTLCRKCHRDFDGAKREEMKPYLKAYLESKYPNWNERDLVYKK